MDLLLTADRETTGMLFLEDGDIIDAEVVSGPERGMITARFGDREVVEAFIISSDEVETFVMDEFGNFALFVAL